MTHRITHLYTPIAGDAAREALLQLIPRSALIGSSEQMPLVLGYTLAKRAIHLSILKGVYVLQRSERYRENSGRNA